MLLEVVHSKHGQFCSVLLACVSEWRDWKSLMRGCKSGKFLLSLLCNVPWPPIWCVTMETGGVYKGCSLFPDFHTSRSIALRFLCVCVGAWERGYRTCGSPLIFKNNFIINLQLILSLMYTRWFSTSGVCTHPCVCVNVFCKLWRTYFVNSTHAEEPCFYCCYNDCNTSSGVATVKHSLDSLEYRHICLLHASVRLLSLCFYWSTVFPGFVHKWSVYRGKIVTFEYGQLL